MALATYAFVTGAGGHRTVGPPEAEAIRRAGIGKEQNIRWGVSPGSSEPNSVGESAWDSCIPAERSCCGCPVAVGKMTQEKSVVPIADVVGVVSKLPDMPVGAAGVGSLGGTIQQSVILGRAL